LDAHKAAFDSPAKSLKTKRFQKEHIYAI